MGAIETRCPKGCEPFQADAWSFVDGAKSEALREAVLAGELNLLACPECGALFFPDVTFVYQDAGRELLAFVFPEGYKAQEARWRAKMGEDFAAMRGVLSRDLPAGLEPHLFFGIEGLRALLAVEDDLEDEVRVMEYLARGLGLALYPVERAYARRRGLPRVLPARAASGKRFSREAALQGLKAVIKANDRLEGYRRWLERFESDGEPVPVLRRK